MVGAELVLILESIGSPYGISPPKILLILLNSENPALGVRQDIVVLVATFTRRSLASWFIPGLMI